MSGNYYTPMRAREGTMGLVTAGEFHIILVLTERAAVPRPCRRNLPGSPAGSLCPSAPVIRGNLKASPVGALVDLHRRRDRARPAAPGFRGYLVGYRRTAAGSRSRPMGSGWSLAPSSRSGRIIPRPCRRRHNLPGSRAGCTWTTRPTLLSAANQASGEDGRPTPPILPFTHPPKGNGSTPDQVAIFRQNRRES